MITILGIFLYFSFLTFVIQALELGSGLNLPDSFGIVKPGGLLDIVGYLFSSVAVFIQLLSFQLEGVPPIINFMLIYPFLAILLYQILRLIRGGG